MERAWDGLSNDPRPWKRMAAMTRKRLTRADLKEGRLYRMNDYYADDGELRKGTVVRVLNASGTEGGGMIRFHIQGIVVVREDDLQAANLLLNPDATAPPEWVVPIKSLEPLEDGHVTPLR
jgi:hypothetical protein